ncbi:hypothetical protein SEPCBS119000_002746 [Sporothrix epigloea]|uniref:Zinc fyve domain containing protein n=1 Tax=Sporothrix epigloea TaxID=1892477 RepID=A0ABP0DJL1_9PEZI
MPQSPDRSLLDRLNALRPSSVSLDTSRTTVSSPPAASTAADGNLPGFTSLGSAADPYVSREDVLASRLKSLRQARDVATELSKEQPVATPSPEARTEAMARKSGRSNGSSTRGVAGGNFVERQVDSQTFNEILRQLAEEGPDDPPARQTRSGNQHTVDDDFDFSTLPLAFQPVPANSDLHTKLADDIQRRLAEDDLQRDNRGYGRQGANTFDNWEEDSLVREFRRVFELAKHDKELAREIGLEEEEEDTASSNHGDKDAPEEKGDKESNSLGLPSVPTNPVEPLLTKDAIGLELPSVPTTDPPKRGDVDIYARFAALQGLRGKATGLGHTTGAFDLPSVPSFQPGEEEGGLLKRGHFGHGRQNYTSADMKGWCIVCLEDATVRCLGCADNTGGNDDADQNNAYCTDCWRDLHVGPAAGFDERGHKRVPLEK